MAVTPPPPSGLPGTAPLAPEGSSAVELEGVEEMDVPPEASPRLEDGAPPPPSGLPGAAPPAPQGLPAVKRTRAEEVDAPPEASPRPEDRAPPPPSGLPDVKAVDKSKAVPPLQALAPGGPGNAQPPPPTGLPAATRPLLKAQPPPPAIDFPPARGEPPPATELPPARGGRRPSAKAGRRRARSIVAADTAPPPPPPPLAPGQLPGPPRIGGSDAEVKRNMQLQDFKDVAGSTAWGADEISPELWQQYIQEDSSEEREGAADSQDSGEDSDEEQDQSEHAASRIRSDMDVLRQHQRGVARGTRRHTVDANAVDMTNTSSAPPKLQSGEEGSSTVYISGTTRASSSSGGGRRSNLLGRFGSKLFKPAVDAMCGSGSVPCATSSLQRLLEEDGTRYNEEWYERWGARLSCEGIACTKVATNGKPYERRVIVDSRNCTIEVRGGRSGSTGILLDDLVDAREGLESPELEEFCRRVKKTNLDPASLEQRALVLQTGNRTFSFLFPATMQKEIFLHFVVHLLRARWPARRRCEASAGKMEPKSKGAGNGALTDLPQRGLGQSLGANEETLAPGKGKLSYPNNSTYEGDVLDGHRHGHGVLCLADGTRYESEWRNDERHGTGKEFWADGTSFTGIYSKGMRHGHGVMTWPEGSRYAGEFERGRANGIGELVRTDGSVYRGQFEEDCMSGQGQMTWQDGVQYTGHFVENRRDGWGKMAWTSGRWRSYDGEWKDGMQHGHGFLTDHSGAQFGGVFMCGKLDRWDDDEEPLGS